MSSNDKNTLTLSQAILAPINSVLQAQVHSARSFVNLVLQMGFKHKPEAEETDAADLKEEDSMYYMDFMATRADSDGKEKKYRVKIPTLAMLPLNPLAIEEAEVSFSMSIKGEYQPQRQFSKLSKKGQPNDKGEKDYDESKRPWYIIDEPVDLTGTIGGNDNPLSKIDIRLKMGKGEVPPQLKKFIATASDFGAAETIEDRPANK